MKKLHETVGILGGTFDPVHNGHLIIAETVMEGFKLDKILFIPSGQPPHKDNAKVSAALHRYNMLVAAVEANPGFEVSRIEMDRLGYTYTIDTITQLKGNNSENRKFYFIIGADVVPELVTWKNFERVFSICEFIAVFRPGNDKERFIEEIERLKNKYMARIHTMEVPAIDISSTDIRNRIMEGKSIKYRVPEKVEAYILANGIYKV